VSTIVWHMLYNSYLLCSQSVKSPLTTCVTCEFGARSWRGVLNTTMRYKFCQLHCSRLVGLFRNWRNPFHQINQRLSRACIVHLVIKRTNWSYVKTMSCSGSHLGIPINIKKHIVCKGPSND
jgi:hypothetical protein